MLPHSGKAFLAVPRRREIYNLLKSILLVVFKGVEPGSSMAKLSQYVSYAALAAALSVGFAVTMVVGFHF